MRLLNRLWEDKPLVLILILASVLRLISAILSQGYGMHDDHFLVIEPAQAWIDKVDYNGWMPMFKSGTVPSGHSLFYPGIHYLVFLLLNGLNINDPQTKMLIVRILHGAFSLLTIYYSYLISLKLSDKKTAAHTALLFAVFWFMPFFSVRNLVEMVCIPFLMISLCYILKARDSKYPLRDFLISGLILGIGFSVRFQTSTFAAGLFLAVLLDKQWKGFLLLGIGYITSILFIQGGIDIFIWGYPFAEFIEYVNYNATHATSYIVNSWYAYLLLILGALVPPISVLLLFGYLRHWKKHLVLFLPAFIFLLFHSLFPNKQERFIIPAIPFIIILGMIGWSDFLNCSAFWKRNKKLLQACWIIFWVLNIILLIPVTGMYSKKARVESMVYLSKYPDIHTVLVEESNRDHGTMLPKYYLKQWIEVREISKTSPMEEFSDFLSVADTVAFPRFVLFFDDKNLEERVQSVQKHLPGLVFEKEIDPGFLDKMLYQLNPLNSNQTIFIYRNTHFYPVRL
ncbi:MAG: glycosyltransferase family 39 protein [Bacteroidales bacterium]